MTQLPVVAIQQTNNTKCVALECFLKTRSSRLERKIVYIYMKETCEMAYLIGWSLNLHGLFSFKIINKIDS